MKTWKNFRWTLFFAIAIIAFLPACKTASNAEKGTVIGAAAGGAVGGMVGKEKGKTALGFIIGAAVGGAAGGVIGKYMDKQADELEDELEGTEIERVGEGILITFDSGLLFDFDSDDLRAETKTNLRSLANSLDKYADTQILIEGHTDARGSDSYNQNLSRERAQSVASYLTAQGVSSSRLITKGYGENQPVASNDTEEGRQLNRRVAVAIVADEELQKDAKEGRINN